jgi:general secretion pathway protein B
MSLILDALNRAESERKNQNPVPDIGTLHAPAETTRAPGSGNRSLFIIAALVVILVFIATAVWFLMKGGKTLPVNVVDSNDVVSADVVQQQSARSSLLSQEQVQEQAQLPQQNIQSIASVENIAVAESAEDVSESIAATSLPASDDVNQLYSAPQTAPAVDTDINDLYATELPEGSTSEGSTSEGSTPIVEPFAATGSAAIAAAEPEVPARTFANITNIPDFNDLPWNKRQSIPTISYARHNFLSDGLSSVVINNQTVGIGNIISVGQFVVQEIYVDGVVLKHGNTQFKLRALNGWINM